MIDLHTHSARSDGSDEPAQLALKAKAAGLSAIALTDHDTTVGLGEMQVACDELGIELVPGIEVSLRDEMNPRRNRDGELEAAHVHLLAYFVPLDQTHPLQVMLHRLRSDRLERNMLLIERLNELGFSGVNLEVLEGYANGRDNIGRPHFARAMIDLHGEIVGPNTDETWSRVFVDWLGQGGRAYVPKSHFTLEEFTRTAKGSGVVFSIAHPLINYANGADPASVMPQVLATLRERGIAGVEAHYGGTDEPTRRLMVKLARDAGLVPTGGSDYHGTFKNDVALGRGRSGDLAVPDEVLEELRLARN